MFQSIVSNPIIRSALTCLCLYSLAGSVYWMAVQLQSSYCAPVGLLGIVSTLFTAPTIWCTGLARISYTASSLMNNYMVTAFTVIVAMISMKHS